MEYIAVEIGDQLYELQKTLDDIYAEDGTLLNVIWRETDHVYIVIYGLAPAAARPKTKEGN